MGGGGTAPAQKGAPVHPQMGAQEHRTYTACCPSSVLDDMQARTMVLIALRSSIGSRSNCHQAAATLAHHVVLLGRAQRCCAKRQILPRPLMITPTCLPALHRLEGRSNTNGEHTTGSNRIGSAPASATAAALKALESTLRHRPTESPPEAPGDWGNPVG